MTGRVYKQKSRIMNNELSRAYRRAGIKSSNISNTSKNGFSLIEVLVATFIFTIVIFMSMIIFSDSVGLKNRSQLYEDVQESAYYPLELISRDLREANDFEIGNLSQCPAGIIVNRTLQNGSDEKLCYFLNQKAIAVKKYQTSNWSAAQNLSSSKVEFEELKFLGQNIQNSQVYQPNVVIKAKVKTLQRERSNDFVELNIQTSVTLRDINWKFHAN